LIGMAAKPQTQLLKLGIGTVTVVGIVGATGWLWQAQNATAAPDQHEEALSPQKTVPPETHRERGARNASGGNAFLVPPGTEGAPSGRTRTHHS
jgi:hypothetical protein